VSSQRKGGLTSATVIATWVVLVAALVTVLAGAIFNFGFFERTESFHGPFDQESSETPLCFVIALGTKSRLPRLFATSGDTSSDPYRSNLKLWINGQSVGPAHTIHREIREQGSGRYSHWGDIVLFSLPAGITNGPDTTAVVKYSPGLRTSIYRFAWLLLVCSASFLALRARRFDPQSLRRMQEFSAWLAGALGFGFLGTASVATVSYLLTIAIGLFQGYALPNTAAFRLLPWARDLAIHEPAAQYVIVLVAMIGSVLSSLSASASRNSEATLIRYWNRYGLLAIAALFLFSIGAVWSGIARPEDLQSNAVGGLVPFHDGRGYFDMTFRQVITGQWEPLIEQRPFAAAHRGLLMFLAGFSDVGFLFLQALTLAAATYAATRAVMVWRGLWSGLTFLGLTVALVRPYLITHLTEPLGQFWALLSIPFVIRLLRGGALVDGAISILAITISLLTRMGSMLTIPALGIWLAWTQSGDAERFKRALVTVTAVLLACSLVTAALVRLYGSGRGLVGSDFSFAICGATHGGNWTKCQSLYQNELAQAGPDFGAAQTHYLYTKAWEAFRRKPSVMLGRLIEGEKIFANNVVTRMLAGYTMPIPPRWFPQKTWTVIALVGLTITLSRRREQSELSFWLCMWLGLFASVPFVIFDDGWRVLSSIFPLIALFLACGFSTHAAVPIAVAPAGSRAPTLALAGVLVTMSLWIVIPGLAHRLDPLSARVFETATSNTGERLVLGRTHMAGFLVVPDDQSVPTDVAAMRRTEFLRAFEYSGNEAYQKLTLPPPSTSFAFVAAPNVNGAHGYVYLAPAEVLTRPDVAAWRFTVEDPIDEGRARWSRVTAATPVAVAPR
jgi:hypothetical protein